MCQALWMGFIYINSFNPYRLLSKYCSHLYHFIDGQGELREITCLAQSFIVLSGQHGVQAQAASFEGSWPPLRCHNHN